MAKGPVVQQFQRKNFTGDEIKKLMARELERGLDPVWKEIGQLLEALHHRVAELEAATNALIEKSKEKENNGIREREAFDRLMLPKNEVHND